MDIPENCLGDANLFFFHWMRRHKKLNSSNAGGFGNFFLQG